MYENIGKILSNLNFLDDKGIITRICNNLIKICLSDKKTISYVLKWFERHIPKERANGQ